MQYVVFDLEWNNVYGRKINGFINEIIEIGAVKLDENLNEISSFSSFVKPCIGKRLRGSVKKLTHITNDDVLGGELFTHVFSAFRKWIGSEPTVILTWGDGDIRVLIENYKYLNGITYIPFLTNYVDLQVFVQRRVKTEKGQQIGLGKAAEALGIDDADYSHHRALDDSRLSAECFRKVFDENDLAGFIRPCNTEFYAKLAFKPHPISNLKNPLVDKKHLTYSCPDCKANAHRQTDWKYSNRFFRAVFKCPYCGKMSKVSVRFMRMYDRVDVKKTVVPYIPPETDKENSE
ncbi:MAG: exonuclease domain-containing protein [Clostridia bacterium]|nr:exonuclease domain-containing protein [Clostridia bacterium]